MGLAGWVWVALRVPGVTPGTGLRRAGPGGAGNGAWPGRVEGSGERLAGVLGQQLQGAVDRDLELRVVVDGPVVRG